MILSDVVGTDIYQQVMDTIHKISIDPEPWTRDGNGSKFFKALALAVEVSNAQSQKTNAAIEIYARCLIAPEQRKIEEVLARYEEVLARYEEVVDRYQKLKKRVQKQAAALANALEEGRQHIEEMKEMRINLIHIMRLAHHRFCEDSSLPPRRRSAPLVRFRDTVASQDTSDSETSVGVLVDGLPTDGNGGSA